MIVQATYVEGSALTFCDAEAVIVQGDTVSVDVPNGTLTDGSHAWSRCVATGPQLDAGIAGDTCSLECDAQGNMPAVAVGISLSVEVGASYIYWDDGPGGWQCFWGASWM